MIIKNQNQIQRFNLDTIESVLIKDFFIVLRDIYGCTYFTYMYQCKITGKVDYISSDALWQEIFVDTGMLNYCHIYNFAWKCGDGINFVIWDNIQPTLSIEKEIEGERKNRDIANGIGFVIDNNKSTESFSFAGDVKNKFFYKNFTNINFIMKCLYKLRLLRQEKNSITKVLK